MSSPRKTARGHASGTRTAVAAAVLLPVLVSLSLASADPEDELKAAAVLSFLRYSQLAVAPGTAVSVGVFGRPAFTEVLARTLESKVIHNRPVRLVSLASTSDLRNCQMIYVASSKVSEVRQIVSAASATHALTIGETGRFLEEGGAINLFLIDGHIGFEVSMDALARSGVAISSSMLRLGQIRDTGRRRLVP
ncbi:MAG TPA: YfiR family protein [Bryobacteraceae bacterium]|nr:YfiR family protein [Bryobacteraceae bacterium]